MRSPLLVGVLLAVVLVLTGCGSSGSKSGASSNATTETTRLGEKPGATVVVKDLAFKPATVTIKKGQVVVWEFDDGSVPHDVKVGDVKSPTLKNATWVHRFDGAGTFSYLCTIHPFMTAKVVVQG